MMKVPVELVKMCWRHYKTAKALLDMIEEEYILPFCRKHNLELAFREDTFEPIWEAELRGEGKELLRYSVYSEELSKKELEEGCVYFGYVVVENDGSIKFKTRRIGIEEEDEE